MNKIKLLFLLCFLLNLITFCGLKKHRKPCDAYGSGKVYKQYKR